MLSPVLLRRACVGEYVDVFAGACHGFDRSSVGEGVADGTRCRDRCTARFGGLSGKEFAVILAPNQDGTAANAVKSLKRGFPERNIARDTATGDVLLSSNEHGHQVGKTVGIVSQARMTSSRLPGKILKTVAGDPILKFHADRVRSSGYPLIVATTTNASDDSVVDFCSAEGIDVWRGDEHHVLGRYYECARHYGLDVVVRVTSDCPLVDGDFIARGIRHYLEQDDKRRYLSSGLSGTIPRGFDFEVFSMDLLEYAFRNARMPAEIEHVTPYLYARSDPQVITEPFAYREDKSRYRVTLDTEDDLRLIRTLIEDHGAHELSIDGIVALLDAHPELVAINAHVEQKEVDAQPDSPVRMNRHGFFEVVDRPSQEELNEYYATKYYQDEDASAYSLSYRPDEIEYFRNKIAQKFDYLTGRHLLDAARPYRLLDVGCGEGFVLKFFKERDWQVTGLDFSRFGCESCNPDCLEDVIVGDIYQNLDALTDSSERYDVIWLDNVLEHVLDPEGLLERLRAISGGPGILIVEVPNDFSVLQRYLLENGHLTRQNWVVVPDHLSYFNRHGLANLCAAAGWTESGVMADFPIDWFLLNEHSNYYADGSRGKAAHKARVTLENMLHTISVEKTNTLYETLADMGMGRQLIGFFTKTDRP